MRTDPFKKIRRKFKAARTRQQKRALAPKEPTLFQTRYQRDLLKFVDRIQDVIRKELFPELRQDGFPPYIQRTLDVIEIKLAEIINAPNIEQSAANVAKQVSSSNTRQWKRLLRIPVDPAVEPLIQSFVTKNTLLIKSQASQTVAGVKQLIEGRIGSRHEDLAAEIEQLFGVQRSKARFIARDQVLKLNGQITQASQQSVGIEEYEWSTSQDENVRETHDDLDGTIQRWDTPPQVSDDGRHEHPGGDYQCRCVAVPRLPA